MCVCERERERGREREIGNFLLPRLTFTDFWKKKFEFLGRDVFTPIFFDNSKTLELFNQSILVIFSTQNTEQDLMSLSTANLGK